MAKRNAADVAKKWNERTKAAVKDWQAGVQSVTEAPGAKAAAAADTWQAKLQQPETLDKYRENVSAVTLAEWRDTTISKGAGRIAAGVDASTPRMQNFLAEFLPHVESVAAQVRTMPHLTVEDGIQRAAAQIRGNAQFRRTRR